MNYNVICVKSGKKYDNSYVNILYNMVQRHLNVPHRFICLTDDTSNINKFVECFPLPSTSVDGWFHKLSLFQEKLYDIEGTILYLDLDIVIVDNITDLILNNKNTYNSFYIIKDWLYETRNIFKYNSSVMKWTHGTRNHLFTDYLNTDIEYEGDQDFITDYISDAEIWPKEWCISFKHSSCYNSFPHGAKIIVFHGNPKPDKIVDHYSWVRKHWQ